MKKTSVDPFHIATVGDLVEVLYDIHRENVNMAERLSRLEDQVEVMLERYNEYLKANR